MTRHLWILGLLVPAIAFAKDDPDFRHEMRQFVTSVEHALSEGKFVGNGRFSEEASKCDDLIKRGNAAGVKPTDTVTGDEGPILWKQAPEWCAKYAKLRVFAKVVEALADPYGTVETFSSLKRPDGSPDTSVSGEVYRGTVDDAKKCIKIVDDAIAAGAPADLKYLPRSNDDTRITLADARKRCTDWVARGGAAAKADEDRKAAEIAALKAKYGKFGITGDRLDYLVKWGHQPVFGAGCGELSGKQLKTAPAFYSLGQDDLAWIVYKTEYRGDKQTRYTSARYRKDGKWYCK